jgi:hypothetical protein
MRLSEFIQDTRHEIALGVEAARVKARDLVAVNPSRLDGERITERSYVDFDVSVVVSESDQKMLGGGGRVSGEINVASVAKVGADLGANSKGSSLVKAEHTHRVAFKVPVYFNATYRGNPAARAEAAAFGGLSANTE